MTQAKLEIVKSAGIGETPRIKAVVGRSGFTLYHRGNGTGWEWEPLEKASGFKSQADALADAKRSLDAWTLTAD